MKSFATLRKVVDQSLKIKTFKYDPACKVGDNYMSNVKRVFIEATLTDAVTQQQRDYKNHLIVKIPLNGDAITKGPKELFKYEALAFNEVIPALEKIAGHSLPVPRCVHASDTIVILEDLKPLGYEIANRKEGMNIEECREVIKALANFHSASILMKQQYPKLFSKLCGLLKDQLYCEENSPITKPSIESAFNLARYRLDEFLSNPSDDLLQAKEKFFKLDASELYDYVQKRLRETSEVAEVIGHNDCWANNIMLRYDRPPSPETGGNNRRVLDAILVDLQSLSKTSLVRDLLYLINTNVVSIDKNILIELYIEYLQSCLRGHGVDNQIVDRYNLDLVNGEIERLKYFGLMKAVWLLIPIALKTHLPRDQSQIAESSILISQCLDKFYDRRIREIILQFDKDGGYKN